MRIGVSQRIAPGTHIGVSERGSLEFIITMLFFFAGIPIVLFLAGMAFIVVLCVMWASMTIGTWILLTAYEGLEWIARQIISKNLDRPLAKRKNIKSPIMHFLWSMPEEVIGSFNDEKAIKKTINKNKRSRRRNAWMN